jgi:hypothetical protein
MVVYIYCFGPSLGTVHESGPRRWRSLKIHCNASARRAEDTCYTAIRRHRGRQMAQQVLCVNYRSVLRRLAFLVDDAR